MEDKLLEGMINSSVKLMEKLSQGQTLTLEELKFILLTQKLIENNNKKNKPNFFEGILNDLKPIVPVIGSLINL